MPVMMFFLFQVCVCDLNKEAGHKTVEDFASEFGEENVKFAHCDVTSDASFRGKLDFIKFYFSCHLRPPKRSKFVQQEGVFNIKFMNKKLQFVVDIITVEVTLL